MKKILTIAEVLLLSGCCALIDRGNKQEVAIYTNAGRTNYVKVTTKSGMVVWEG